MLLCLAAVLQSLLHQLCYAASVLCVCACMLAGGAPGPVQHCWTAEPMPPPPPGHVAAVQMAVAAPMAAAMGMAPPKPAHRVSVDEQKLHVTRLFCSHEGLACHVHADIWSCPLILVLAGDCALSSLTNTAALLWVEGTSVFAVRVLCQRP